MGRPKLTTALRIESMINRITRTASGCWEWQGDKDRRGYGIIRTWEGFVRRTGAHRIAWTVFRGPIPDGLCVLHRCDNPPCVNPAHLFLGTQADNMADMAMKNRHWRRTTIKPNGREKMDAESVAAVRRRFSEGATYEALRNEFGISIPQIYNIISRRQWKAVP